MIPFSLPSLPPISLNFKIITVIFIDLKKMRVKLLCKKRDSDISQNLFLVESGRRDSNPRPSAWKANALSTELLPRLKNTLENRGQ